MLRLVGLRPFDVVENILHDILVAFLIIVCLVSAFTGLIYVVLHVVHVMFRISLFLAILVFCPFCLLSKCPDSHREYIQEA